MLSPFEEGFLLGLLVGEGSFGGTGKAPQITLRMHTRHERMFAWLQRRFPDSRLYGPYFHGGRQYLQWMARGNFLRQTLVPLIAKRARWLDPYVRERFLTMCASYGMSPGEPEAGDAGLEG